MNGHRISRDGISRSTADIADTKIVVAFQNRRNRIIAVHGKSR